MKPPSHEPQRPMGGGVQDHGPGPEPAPCESEIARAGEGELYRIAIVGTRLRIPWDAPRAEQRRLAHLMAAVEADIIAFVNRQPGDVIIVSGGAPGPDTFAKRAALRRFGRPGYKEHSADWDKHGKSAGFIRNQLIVDDSHVVHGWWDGKSRGTADTKRRAEAAGLAFFVHSIQEIADASR